MTLRIKRIYTCNHCDRKDSNISSSLMLPKWFHLELIPSILYGDEFRDLPLRAANAIRPTGDYCSLGCLHIAMRKAVEDILVAVRDETNKINLQESEASRNNVSEDS